MSLYRIRTHASLPFQTFGFIFGLSDAIIGLTIFAVGNSLADLVANTSVAVRLTHALYTPTHRPHRSLPP